MRVRYGLLLCLFISVSGLANDQCRPWEALDASKNWLVGDIHLDVADVFDTTKEDENKWFHQWANRLHGTTKVDVIKRQLLFKEGEVFDVSLLEESERLLRQNNYIKDAKILPKEVCGNLVSIDVNTVDHWTLSVGGAFGRSGGKNKSGFEFQEHNLLGLGKSLSLAYKSDAERDGTQLLYEDAQLFGSRHQLALLAEQNSDGKVYGVDLGLPFFSLHTSNSWGIGGQRKSQQISLYDAGNVVDTFDDELQTAYMFYGWAKEPVGDAVQRYRVGWNYSKERYAATVNSSELTEVNQSYPWIEYAFYENEYLKRENLNTMGVIEDTQIGRSMELSVGLLSSAFGSTDDYLRVGARYSRGFQLTDKQLGVIGVSGNSYLGEGELQGIQSNVKGQYYYFKNQKDTLYLSGEVWAADNFLSKEQYELGGDVGLRGYPQGFQSGDRAALLSMEYRHYFDYYPWKLAKFGAVAFADVGTAWDSNKDPELLSDMGFGLRIVPTRSSSSRVIHLDVAFPLDSNGQVDSVQYLLSTKKSF